MARLAPALSGQKIKAFFDKITRFRDGDREND